MTPERTKELLPVMQAHSEGRKIECRLFPMDPWQLCEHPNWDDEFSYRIKPEPKLREWTTAEIPVGALFRHKAWHDDTTSLIIRKCSDCFFIQSVTLMKIATAEALQDGEYSFDLQLPDDKKVWRLCGVKES